MRSKMEDVRCKMADGRWMMWLCAALFTIHCSLFTSCKQEDDTIVIINSRRWVEKTVAVVAPLNDPIMKARLERTAEWMLSSLHNAQLHDTLCINLKLEWYDEYGTDLKALGERLANRNDLMAVIGPFDSDNVDILAPYCQQTLKPLILPTATSETVIRRFAITSTGDGQQPFLWSLTETDVSLVEVMQLRYAANIQRNESYARYADYAGLFTPNNKYGQTFFDWAPFQAAELGIGFRWNVQYSDSEMLYEKLQEYYYDIDDVSYNSSAMPPFVVIEHPEQMVEISRFRYLWWGLDMVEIIKSWEADGLDISDYSYINSYSGFVVNGWAPICYVLSNLTDEGIAALGPYDALICDQYEGYSPYADPMTGFEDMTTENGEVYICGGNSGRSINPGANGSVYFLTETQAPLNYTKLEDDIVFRISPIGVPSLITDNYNGQLVETEDSYIYTLSVPNEKKEDEKKLLTIRKTVSGDLGDPVQEFDFTFNVASAEPTDEFEWMKNSVQQNTSLHSGDTFTIKHGDEVIIAVPAGANLTISEDNLDYYTTFQLDDGEPQHADMMAFELTDDATLEVVNKLDGIVPTGVMNNIILPILSAVLTMALVTFIMRKKRKS